ncbi:hypothetical protein [Actinomycetospora aeridis]|uniref:Uncharacterized protein n=1 Tax=Actinomycetospora aeridis TaxID=3129231 RepID=A0ABU8NC23_9PSEU
MSFDIPLQGPIGPVTIAGIPTQFGLGVTALPPVSADAHVALDPVAADAHVALDPVAADAHVALDPVTADARVALEPVAVDLAVSRLPDVRAHVPANFSVSLCLFGITVFSIHLCGEAQVVTEPYRPTPSELATGTGGPPP